MLSPQAVCFSKFEMYDKKMAGNLNCVLVKSAQREPRNTLFREFHIPEEKGGMRLFIVTTTV